MHLLHALAWCVSQLKIMVQDKFIVLWVINFTIIIQTLWLIIILNASCLQHQWV